MNELSLFSGAGGGLLGTKLLGWRSVGYVENNTYCQQILAQRIKDGWLDEAPIFGDINGFIESGAVDEYKGITDVVSGGFPCQPFSVAGKKRGKDDDRNLWPETLAVIRAVRPRYALLENVPGLLNSGYFPEILGSLAESGFDVRWDCISAAAVGAPHRRDRLWILAKSQHPDTYSIGSHRAEKHQHGSAESTDKQVGEPGSVREVLAHSISDPERTAHGNTERISGWEGEDICEGGPLGSDFGDSGEYVADSDSTGLSQRRWTESVEKEYTTAECGGEGQSQSHWPTEPELGRVAHGVAHRVDRIKAIGNGQVPRVVATAWEILTGE